MNDQDRITQLEAALVIANQSISEMQPALGKLKDQLQAVEAESKSRRKEIASLDEQLAEAKRAIETQYNLRQAVEKSHTALRLASEELIACVRHGDQEDIGEAMGKIESILQPAQKDPQ